MKDAITVYVIEERNNNFLKDEKMSEILYLFL